MADDPKARAEELRKQLLGLLYLAFQRGRDSLCGTAANRDKFYEQAGAGLLGCSDDAEKLHSAYLEFLRSEWKNGAKPK